MSDAPLPITLIFVSHTLPCVQFLAPCCTLCFSPPSPSFITGHSRDRPRDQQREPPHTARRQRRLTLLEVKSVKVLQVTIVLLHRSRITARCWWDRGV